MTLIPSGFAFYIVIWGYFDRLKMPFKVILRQWTFCSNQISNQSFKLGTKQSFWSRDCKNIRCHRLRSKKIYQFSLTPISFWPPTLAANIFKASWLDLQECTAPNLKDLIQIVWSWKAKGMAWLLVTYLGGQSIFKLLYELQIDSKSLSITVFFMETVIMR